MRAFKDNNGRSWSVVINVTTIKRVRGLLEIDLMEAVEGNLLERLVTDPVILCDIVYVLCKPDADASGITDEQFGEAMFGDALAAATTALLEALVEFFPLPKRRLLEKALEKMRALEVRALEMAEKRMDSPELETEIENALKDIGTSSGSSPELPELTPAP